MTIAKRLLLILVLGVLLALAGCATVPSGQAASAVPGSALRAPEKFYVPTDSEVLFGTWKNPANHPPTFYPKVVIHPWGLVEYFQRVDSTSYAWRGTSTIVDKWVDADGATWYKEFYRCSLKGFYSGHAFALSRISADGFVLETIFGNLDWPGPTEMDPELNTTYAAYRKQK